MSSPHENYCAPGVPTLARELQKGDVIRWVDKQEYILLGRVTRIGWTFNLRVTPVNPVGKGKKGKEIWLRCWKNQLVELKSRMGFRHEQ